MPVDLPQEGFDGACRSLVVIKHILGECNNPQRPEQARNPLVHLFRKYHVGPAQEDDVDTLVPLRRFPVEHSPPRVSGFIGSDHLVVRAGDIEEADPRMNCCEHPKELRLCAERGVEVGEMFIITKVVSMSQVCNAIYFPYR
jgi:hypothetical protein